MDIYNQISNIGIVPVVQINEIKDALPLAKALIKGGIPCAEITFRTDKAKEAIEIISKAYPEMIVGAGTVTNIENVDKAIAAGAKFIVSPGISADVVLYCKEKNIPIIPGTANASDLEVATSLGLDYVKFFPAEVNGGLKAIKALSGPFPNLRFMPTGGLNSENFMSYLESDQIIACGGSWMVSDHLVRENRFDEITRICSESIRKMLGFEVEKIEGDSEVLDILNLLTHKKIDSSGSNTVNVTCNSIKRTEQYLKRNGKHVEKKENRLYLEIDTIKFIFSEK